MNTEDLELELFNENIEPVEEDFKNVVNKIVDINDLREQWKKVADKFVRHKWIYRYIDEKQKVALQKHYDILCDENSSYSKYKTSFKAIAKFMGLPADIIIIENMTFTKDKKDKEQEIVAVKYSKGLAKIKIPKGINLVHVSPVDNIQNLIPSFRSKVKGKYMYPSKRCFFTVEKTIKKSQAGLEKQTLTKYTPKTEYMDAYIDPTYSEFKNGSIYIDTESPIPVEKYDKKMVDLFKKHEKKEGEK